MRIRADVGMNHSPFELGRGTYHSDLQPGGKGGWGIACEAILFRVSLVGGMEGKQNKKFREFERLTFFLSLPNASFEITHYSIRFGMDLCSQA